MAMVSKKSPSRNRRTEGTTRRRFLALMASAAAVPLVSGRARAAGSKYVMKVAHVLTEADNVHRALGKFKEVLEKKAPGQVEVQIYPNSALGSLRVTFDSIQLGTLEAGVYDAATPGNVVPMWNAPELPYLFRDLDHVHKVVDGPIGRELDAALLQKARVRTLAAVVDEVRSPLA